MGVFGRFLNLVPLEAAISAKIGTPGETFRALSRIFEKFVPFFGVLYLCFFCKKGTKTAMIG